MARKIPLKLHLPPELKSAVEAVAAARKESIGVVVREALDRYLSNQAPAHAVAEDQAPYGAGQRPPPGTYPAVDALYQVIAEETAKRAKKPAAGYARRDPAATPAPAPAD